MATKKELSTENVESTKTSKEAALEAQLASLMETIKTLQAQVANTTTTTTAATAAPTVVVQAPTTDVTLVYMDDCPGYMKVNNLELHCSKFGESFTLSRTDFDAVVGAYRHWFDRGVLAVSAEDIKVAAAKGLKTDKEYSLNADTLEKMGKMTCEQIEKLWNEIKTESHRLSIVMFFKRKFIEDKDPGYRDRAKVDLLNRLTDGGFDREVTELSGRNLKIQPTELI